MAPVSATSRDQAGDRAAGPAAIREGGYVGLLLALLGLLLLHPFAAKGAYAEVALDSLLTLVLLVALWSTGASIQRRLQGIALALPALLALWWPANPGAFVSPQLAGLALAAAFLALVTYTVGRDVFSRSRVTTDTLCGAVSIYMLLGLAWMLVYMILEIAAPGSFALSRTDIADYNKLAAEFIYFSYTTLTTTGYGDITPRSDFARSLTVVEHGTGVLYVAILMARLVSLYQPQAESAVD